MLKCGALPQSHQPGTLMTQENMADEVIANETSRETVQASSEDALDEEFESIGDHHRMAAHHFTAAAKHHLLAAEADDDGDDQASARHAHLAYRHQLNGVQYAEIAVMDNESLEEAIDDATLSD